ncbi:hypothetical protein DFH07DRAFT_784066 [Mycena maculata]|uniref:Uncharacterized protein n=1 Tax=Mycena maculata TaxID=230809 RepID=A0AAD7HK52_9AGAR|nr:hypothetical protein DFH07DRAFT_784066 [Mycena maculata]
MWTRRNPRRDLHTAQLAGASTHWDVARRDYTALEAHCSALQAERIHGATGTYHELVERVGTLLRLPRFSRTPFRELKNKYQKIEAESAPILVGGKESGVGEVGSRKRRHAADMEPEATKEGSKAGVEAGGKGKRCPVKKKNRRAEDGMPVSGMVAPIKSSRLRMPRMRNGNATPPNSIHLHEPVRHLLWTVSTLPMARSTLDAENYIPIIRVPNTRVRDFRWFLELLLIDIRYSLDTVSVCMEYYFLYWDVESSVAIQVLVSMGLWETSDTGRVLKTAKIAVL